MDDFGHINFNYYQPNDMFPNPMMMEDPQMQHQKQMQNDPPPPPPIVICPTEVDNINVTLEKNQQCACKDCGKLFNSVWYLKQHAVKHSNDRPFKCKFCYKTYKFRSNLYQHKCPDRQKSLQQMGRRRGGGQVVSQAARKPEQNQLLKSKTESNIPTEEVNIMQTNCFSEGEDNDAPITYGLVIQTLEPNNQLLSPQIPNAQLSDNLEPCDIENLQADLDSIRGQQLPSDQIEDFVEKNRSKLFTCRKCRVFLPTEESLLRHSASHSGEDLLPFKCANCPQAFGTEKDLRRHAAHHALDDGPWKCDECYGVFRSSVALRRHKDQCRPCIIPRVQNNIMVSVHSPFDPFSFIPSESDNFFLPMRYGTDSGMGSEGSPNSMSHSSPDRPTMNMEDAFDIMGNKKKDKEDDEDSGFRSRLNSVTQSCSPESYSSHNNSPRRKMSSDNDGAGAFSLGGFGSGPTYGQQLFFEQSVGGIDHTTFGSGFQMTNRELIQLRNGDADVVALTLPPVVFDLSSIKPSKEMFIDYEFENPTSELVSSEGYDDGEWKKFNKDTLMPVDQIENYLAAVIIMHVLVAVFIHLKFAQRLIDIAAVFTATLKLQKF